MPRVIDNRVVEMEFDNANFEKNVGKSLSTLDKLKAALSFKGAEHDFGVVEHAAEGLGKSFSVMEQIATGALRSFGTKLEAWAANTVKTMSGVTNIIEGMSKFEKITKSSATLLAQGFDNSEVSRELQKLNWFTDETSYNLTDMVDNISKFTATGQGLQDSADAMMGIALWAAKAGQDAPTASRAMYQLSQAMGAYMRKEDWKSVQNANMDMQEFRQLAMDTAVELKTLKKNADGTYRSLVARSKSGGASFSVSQFADSLTEGAWFTPEVMMKVYSKYNRAAQDIYAYMQKHTGSTVTDAIEALGDTLDEFSLKAFLAGQEARSWGDAVNSVKDALSTKWMGIFQYIFGESKEATKFFTDLAYAFYDMFVEPMSAVVNAFGLWKSAFGQQEWQSSIVATLESFNTILNTIRETFDKFIFGDRANKIIEERSRKIDKLRKKFEDNNEEYENVVNGNLVFFDNDGSDGLIEARADALMELTHGFTSFSEKVQAAAENTSLFERLTRGVLSAFGLIKEAVSGLWNALDPFKPIVTGALKILVSGILSLADAISKLYKSVKKNNTFTKLFISILQPFVTLYAKLREFIEKFVPRFQARWESFTSHFGKLGDRAEGVKKKFDEFFSSIKSKWEKLFSNWDVDKTIDGIFNGLSKVKQFVYDLIGVKDDEGFAEWVDNTLTSASKSFEDFKENVETTFGSLWEDLKRYWKEALTWIEAHWDGITSTFSDIFEGITGFITAFWAAVKGFFSKDANGDGTSGLDGVIQAFKDFGTILGTVLAAIGRALKPLADGIKNTLESMSLEGAGDALTGGGIAALGIAFYKWSKGFSKSSWLGGFRNVLEGIGDTLDGFTKLLDAKALKETAVGIAILVASLFILISIPREDLTAAASVMATIIFILSKSLKELNGFKTSASINSKGFNFSKSGAGSTLLMAALSFVAIAAVLKIIAKIPEDDLYRAMTVVTVLMTVMTFMLKAIMKLQKSGDTTNNTIKNKNSGNIGIANNSLFKTGPAATIFAFAIFLGAVVLALKKVSDLSKDKAAFTTAVATVGAIVLALGVFLGVVGSFYKQTEKNGKITAPSTTLWKNLLAISAAIYIIAMAFEKIATIEAGPLRLTVTGVFIAGIIGLFILLAEATKGRSFDNFGKMAKGLITVSLAIGIIALIMVAMAKVKPAQGRWIGVIAAISAIGVILGGLAYLSAKMIKTEKAAQRFSSFAKSLIIIGGAIAVASIGLYALAQIDSDKLLTALGAMAIVMGAFAAAGAIGKFLGDGLIKFAKALTYIAGAVALMAVAFLAAAEAIRIFGDSSTNVHQAAENIKTFMDEIVDNLGQWAIRFLTQFLEVAVAAVPATIKALVDTIAVTLADLTEKDATGKMKIEKMISSAVAIVVAVANGITERAAEIVFALGNMLLHLLDALGDWVLQNGPDIAKALNKVVQGIINTLLELFSPLGEKIFGEAWDGENGIKTKIQNNAKTYLGGAVLMWLGGWVAKVLGVLSPISSFISTILTGISSISGLLPGLVAAAGTIAAFGFIDDAAAERRQEGLKDARGQRLIDYYTSQQHLSETYAQIRKINGLAYDAVISPDMLASYIRAQSVAGWDVVNGKLVKSSLQPLHNNGFTPSQLANMRKAGNIFGMNTDFLYTLDDRYKQSANSGKTVNNTVNVYNPVKESAKEQYREANVQFAKMQAMQNQ